MPLNHIFKMFYNLKNITLRKQDTKYIQQNLKKKNSQMFYTHPQRKARQEGNISNCVIISGLWDVG